MAKKWHLGAGFIGGAYRLNLSDQNGSVRKFVGLGITYGLATYGSEEKNMTFGIGMPMSTRDKLINNPIFVVNGIVRVGRKVSLISENWIFVGSNALDEFGSLFGYGIRLSGDIMCFDIGFINNKNIAGALIIGIPYIDFVYRFGKL